MVREVLMFNRKRWGAAELLERGGTARNAGICPGWRKSRHRSASLHPSGAAARPLRARHNYDPPPTS